MDKVLLCQPAYKKQKINDKPEDKESICKYNELSSKASENAHDKKKQDVYCSDDDKIATEDSEMTDTHYFRCYADLSVHRVMIGDFERTHAYRKAILSNYKLFHKKVVADVGAGTGILSIFCAQAGAKRVYAIEASSVAEEAKKVVAANGLSDRITVIQEKVEMVSLPEKVDVIVSEWMGYMLMYESMLPSLLHARDQWLKEGGLLFPDEVNMYLAPISDYQQYEYSVDFWNKVDDMYKVDMSVLAETAAQQLQEFVHVVSVDPSSVQAHASCLTRIKLSSVEAAMTDCIQGSFMCSCFGSTIVHGFVIWFTVHFPSSVTLSTSPFENETHWEQSVLYIPPVAVEQNTLLNGRLSIKRNSNYHRFLDVDLEYQVDSGERKSQTYKMKD